MTKSKKKLFFLNISMSLLNKFVFGDYLAWTTDTERKVPAILISKAEKRTKF